MLKFCLILAVVVVVSVSAGTAKGPNHYEKWKGIYDGLKKCNEGFKGLTESQLAASQRCQDMNIQAWNCFISCYRYETKMVKDGVWQHEVAEAEISSQWDATHQNEAKKWYNDTHDCVKAHAMGGDTWSNDYTGTCESDAIEKGKACVAQARACKT